MEAIGVQSNEFYSPLYDVYNICTYSAELDGNRVVWRVVESMRDVYIGRDYAMSFARDEADRRGIDFIGVNPHGRPVKDDPLRLAVLKSQLQQRVEG